MKMKAFTKENLMPLIQKYQRNLSLDDVDAIIELDSIACRIEKGVEAVENRDWFIIGDRFYTQPTFARMDLMDRISAKFHTDAMALIGILYALDMDTEDFTKAPSIPTLVAYRMSIKAPISEITRKLNIYLPSSEKEEGSGGGSIWRLCCLLAREVGGSPEEWMNASMQKIGEAVDVVNEKIECEARAASGKKQAPRETPRLLAIKEFKDKLDALEASWRA